MHIRDVLVDFLRVGGFVRAANAQGYLNPISRAFISDKQIAEVDTMHDAVELLMRSELQLTS